jgi:hypothetical protein
MPEPEKGKKYNYALAATKAFFTVAHKVTFSVDTLKKYEDKVFAMYQDNLDTTLPTFDTRTWRKNRQGHIGSRCI